MSIKDLVSNIKHNGLLVSMTQLEKLYKIAIENEGKLTESEARCAALAAELSAVETIHNDAVFITDEHYEQCPPEVQKMIRSLAVLQIPECHVFLAEVRAQGVEMFAAWNDKHIKKGVEHKESLTAVSHAARWFAALLRKGVQL